MTTKYRIHWKAIETGKEGHGKPIFNTVEMAQYTADQLNRESNILVHWVEPVEVTENEDAQ